jgi:NAD(P)-dependent dehydrogenase (short-subunit alcohol dehydrogenase family)
MTTHATKNKLVVITGATRGLGLAMVQGFRRAGLIVAGCGRSADRINQLQIEYPRPHNFATVDVADESQVRRWAAGVTASLGAPDLLVNNAALINRNAPLWQVSAAEFSRVVDVNLKGAVHVIRHFAPAMIARGSGVIVNFSSGWGRSVDAEVAPYCATKWAIEGLTQALAQELPADLAAVPLNPGIINTAMLQSCFGPANASAYPTAAQWAERAVPFLLSLNRSHNGQSLTVP